MDELHDIKPVIDYAPGVPWWVYALAAVAIGIFAVWFLLRHKKKPTPVVDPNRMTLLSLEALRGVSPRDRVSAERLQTQLSMVLRRWVEVRWGIRATDMTTEEIAAHVEMRSALGVDRAAVLVDLLAFADRVRFAGVEATGPEHMVSVERAQALVAQG